MTNKLLVLCILGYKVYAFKLNSEYLALLVALERRRFKSWVSWSLIRSYNPYLQQYYLILHC